MEPLDWGVIGIYFFVIGFVAWWYGRNQQDTTDFFLAGRNAGWVVIGASIFTSNIGSEHIVGLAGQGAATGMAMAHWEMHAWCLIILAGLFVPFYYKSAVETIPEFLERRFNARTRLILSCVSLVAYIFTKVSVTVYAGAIVFQALLPDTFGSPQNAFWVGAFFTVIVTGVYTVFGGIRAILYTAAPQAVIILFGSFVITFIGLDKLGGWNELVSTCKTQASDFALWRPLSDPDFPWLGVLIASPIIGLWYWCTDQYIVQRALSAKNLATARRGALFGGLLKVWPVLIFLIPGMIGWALDNNFNVGKDDPALAQTYSVDMSKDERKQLQNEVNERMRTANAETPEEGQHHFYIARELKEQEIKNESGEKERVLLFKIAGDQVFPTLVTQLLPVGIRGLIVACLLSALMSSLASLFNSSASLFTVDIYEKLRPGKPEDHLLVVGRVATTVVVGLGIIWIPVMYRIASGGLYQYLQSVQGYLAPPITAVFFLGLFWPRLNAAGASWALGLGFILGMAKLTIQMFYGFGAGKAADPEILAYIGDFNFLYATGVLFLCSAVIFVVVSLADSTATRGEDPRPHVRLDPRTRSRRDPEELGLRQHPHGHAHHSLRGWDVPVLQLLVELTR